MASRQDQFTRFLHEHALNITAPRLNVLNLLSDGHPRTMRELIDSCHDTDRATIYRTVNRLESIGMIHRVYTGWKYQVELSELFGDHHHHAHCVSCGTSIALPHDDKLEAMFAQIANIQGFLMQRHALELEGLCAQCKPSPRTGNS